MNLDRPHGTSSTPATAGELFICFASRLSHSSSMHISSKSILSPGRTGDKPSGSSSNTNHSLRRNGSLRGGAGAGAGSTAVGQSPSMFSSKKSKGGGLGFDNPEPSSPKVTCIGQVRVKTKKQGKKMKMRSCRSKSIRRFDGGDSLGGSNRNQGWVHLPVAICEAVRAFGNEFSCLLQCKSSCFSNCGRERGADGDGVEGKDGYSPCGAVCRWLVAMQDVEEEKGRRDDEERVECSRRRSIFDDMEFNGGEVSGGRVSICVPPKNALLLMRCRSDPMKISALSQKIWEAPVAEFDPEAEDGKVECGGDVEVVCLESEKCGEVDEICEEVCLHEENGDGYDLDIFNEDEVETEEIEKVIHMMEEGEDEQVECEKEAVWVEDKIESGESEVDLVKETKEEQEEEITEESNELSCFSADSSVEELTVESLEENEHVNDLENDQEMVKSIDEGEDEEEKEEESLEDQSLQEMANEEHEMKSNWEEQEIKKPVLPDCLLLMMREPKLSMEVSKETWICSTDFVRWLPERHPYKKSAKVHGSNEPKKKESGVAPPVQPVQQVVQVPVLPGRSSISFPTGGGPVAKMIEQKLVKSGGGVGGIEPFVLTRCKSAPLRSAVKNGLPELPCSLWRESSRKIEPHRPSFGTTGVGF